MSLRYKHGTSCADAITASLTPRRYLHALRRPSLVEEGELPLLRQLPMLSPRLGLRPRPRASHGVLPSRLWQGQRQVEAETVLFLQEEEEEAVGIGNVAESWQHINTAPARSERTAAVSGGRRRIRGRQIQHALGGHHQELQAPTDEQQEQEVAIFSVDIGRRVLSNAYARMEIPRPLSGLERAVGPLDGRLRPPAR